MSLYPVAYTAPQKVRKVAVPVERNSLSSRDIAAAETTVLPTSGKVQLMCEIGSDDPNPLFLCCIHRLHGRRVLVLED